MCVFKHMVHWVGVAMVLSCMCAVNQGAIRQPLAMVCPASVDLIPDGYHKQEASPHTHCEDKGTGARLFFIWIKFRNV